MQQAHEKTTIIFWNVTISRISQFISRKKGKTSTLQCMASHELSVGFKGKNTSLELCMLLSSSRTQVCSKGYNAFSKDNRPS